MRRVNVKFLSSWQILTALIAGVGITAGIAYTILVVRPEIKLPDFLTQAFSNSGNNNTTSSATIDNRTLEVEVILPERIVSNPETEITVITNKEVTFGEKDFLLSELVGNANGLNYYIVTVGEILQMGRKFKLEMVDAVGNKFTQDIDIQLRPIALPAGVGAIKGWPDSEYILDGDEYDAQVGKSKRLREDYVPSDLVNLNKKYGIYTLNSAMLRADAALALSQMLQALKRDTGISDVTVVSGYRSYETQMGLYASWVVSSGQQRADEVSARPGHSDHQLGTTCDLSTVSMNYRLSEEFTTSVAGQWLKEHAAEFGFRQHNNPDYSPEPWQFRYFGIDQNASDSE